MAFWAFCLGYLVSSLIQVFVTEERMQRTMGDAGPRAVALATFFGFVSSSCSFAALSTSRALFQKGAGLVPALAFLLASTNLVVELGILILIFLSWQFVVGEYLGGLILIALMWGLVRLTLPEDLEREARQHAGRMGDGSGESVPDWRSLAASREGWIRVGRRYGMEWRMVWKDVTFGFTVAGAIAAFVPSSFFEALFVGSAGSGSPVAWQVALHTLIGPLAAFFTFIGSMGNVPLAAILFGSGVSFAGVMAFVFSDLVVFPVLRISAQYFGWKMAAYILAVFLVCLVATSLVLHVGMALLGLLPDPGAARVQQVAPSERFRVDYTLLLNGLFLAASAGLCTLGWKGGDQEGGGGSGESSWMDRLLSVLAIASIGWLGVGTALFLTGA
jgi:uncharacterized membrane protein YraQ (UPF0718 family)